MPSNIEKLLAEMLYFKINRASQDSDEYIKQAFETIEIKTLYVRIRNLLTWIDPKSHHAKSNLRQYDIYEDFMSTNDFELVYAEYQSVFDAIPELEQLFHLKDQCIVFNSRLTKSDIQEIYKYVETENTVRPINFYRPAKG